MKSGGVRGISDSAGAGFSSQATLLHESRSFETLSIHYAVHDPENISHDDCLVPRLRHWPCEVGKHPA